MQLLGNPAVRVLLEAPPQVHVTLQLPADAAAAWEKADELRQQAAAADQRAATLRRQVVRQLLTEGWSQADASAALGLSYQRFQQLACHQDRL